MIQLEELTLKPRQNDRHFANSIFICIFLNENVLFKNSLSLSNQQYSSFGSNNGLEPARWQAIIWTDGG